jgi:hypothetical protein
MSAVYSIWDRYLVGQAGLGSAAFYIEGQAVDLRITSINAYNIIYNKELYL